MSIFRYLLANLSVKSLAIPNEKPLACSISQDVSGLFSHQCTVLPEKDGIRRESLLRKASLRLMPGWNLL